MLSFLVAILHISDIVVFDPVGAKRKFYASINFGIFLSHNNANSFYYYIVALFLSIVATCKYDYSPNLNTMVKKLFVVGVFKMLTNFNKHL
jgi:hypothetical protein